MECIEPLKPARVWPDTAAPVPLRQATRLINHGPTVLVSAAHAGVSNVMAAAWSMPLDFDPPRVAVVIDKGAFTRPLIERSSSFALNVPASALALLTLGVGSDSAHEVPSKLQRHGVRTFPAREVEAPLVEGCVAWLECRLRPEPHNQQAYDLFIGEVVAAWADPRVFRDGTWHFEAAPEALRSLHYVGNGKFYRTGDAQRVSLPPVNAD